MGIKGESNCFGWDSNPRRQPMVMGSLRWARITQIEKNQPNIRDIEVRQTLTTVIIEMDSKARRSEVQDLHNV